MLGLSGQIQVWNPAAERIYGSSEAEALRPEVIADARCLIGDGVMAHHVKQGIAKDGRTEPI